MRVHEPARAKINLTLRVLGRRADGYHEIESLVAFASVCDHVTLVPGPARRVEVSGSFAGDLTGHNILARTLDLLGELNAGLILGAVHLEKNLPVAAGLGGGSADAGALLRAVRSANALRAEQVAWHNLATRLGADVPACLADSSAVISGIGDRIEPLEGSPALPAISAVLVNPRQALPTAQVYRALGAPALSDDRASTRLAPVAPFPDVASLVEYMRKRGNDLERPATALLPTIGEVKAALTAQPGCSLAAMSGSGPTCFGIFAEEASAARAAAAIASLEPQWWVVATHLGDRSKEGRSGTIPL